MEYTLAEITVKTTRLSLSLSVLLVVIASCNLCAARDIAVVVEKGSSVSALSSTELSKIFKAGTHAWPDGKKVTVFLTDLDSPDSKTVLQKVYGISAEEAKGFVDAHHGEIIVVGSDELVLKAVQTNPGAVGVVNVYSINSGIKVLKIDGKLPLEPGYLLHATN